MVEKLVNGNGKYLQPHNNYTACTPNYTEEWVNRYGINEIWQHTLSVK